jgi:indole-3-glycerol phosphate synthase
MIDRLSILALKIFHTREEVDRAAAAPAALAAHAQRNLQRLAVLEEQRADLADCLDALWQSTLSGSLRFKLYRQLKMYNDPTLNPAIYRNRPA